MRALSDWFYANKLSLNVLQTTFVVFAPKNTNNNITSITLGNQQVLRVNKAKFVDIYIDNGLEWDDHTNYIQWIKCNSYGQEYLYVDSLKSLYYSLIHYHLTYGTMLWGSA